MARDIQGRTVVCRWVLSLIAGLAVGPGLRVVGDETASSPPNIVMIISDDQAWNDYGFMGHPEIRTPSLDRLAEQSLLFPRGYVPSSLCCPSLATIITGLHPWQHGVTGNEPPRPRGVGYGDPGYRAEVREMIAMIDKVPTLPRLLEERGYRSFQSGKWWMGHHSRGGFTEGMTHGDPDRGGRHGDEGLKIGREGMEPIFDFIRSSGPKPFFVWYAPFLPHTPHNPPERLLARNRDRTDSLPIARYWAMCEWFDETCGELIGFLDREGLSENTMVLYVTDNGWINRADASRYAPRSKRSPYDGGIRTPIMVRWPGKVKPGIDLHPVSSIDLAPTVLQAAGLKPPGSLPGINLLDPAAVKGRERIFGDIYLHNARDLNDPPSNLTHRWCVEGEWKLIVPHQLNVPEGKPELFRITSDPHEKTNLAAKNPDQVRDLTARLDAWWNPTGRGHIYE